jgi:hypothetical protein
MLIGNGVRLNSNPMRQMFAPLANVVHRAEWAQAGARCNFYAGEATVVSGASIANKSGYPEGLLHPSSWSMPIKAGGMSSRFNAEISLAGSGTAFGGVAAAGTATIEITTTGTAELLALLSGTATITLDSSGLLTASLNATGTATVTLTAAGDIGALAELTGTAPLTITGTASILPTGATPPILTGTATITITGSLVPYAIGNMTGTTEESGLTPAGIANRVWSQIIEAGFSAEQIVRLLAAHAAGAATGLEGANPQFTGLDGTTLRIDGTYNAGTRTIDALDGD